jgi:molybdopterin converting factor small subunit
MRFFARAREAAGTGDAESTPGITLRVALDEVCDRYGPDFRAVLEHSKVWVNGEEPADGDATVLAEGDEVAVLPPVSGGG